MDSEGPSSPAGGYYPPHPLFPPAFVGHHPPGMGQMTPTTDPELEIRRAKARERQRKKRARDRSIASSQGQAPKAPVVPGGEEDIKRQKIRIAARERQRKHRAVVKARRLAEMDGPLPDQATYEQGIQYPPYGPDGAGAEPRSASAAYGAPPGHIFANTLFLALACAPMLKVNLLRTFNVPASDLPSLEATIATAFEHWNHDRYAVHPLTNTGATPISMSQSPPQTPQAYQLAPALPDSATGANSDSDYRTRFHRSVNGPTPFNRPPLSAESMPGAPSSSRLEPLPSSHNEGKEDDDDDAHSEASSHDEDGHDDGHGRLSHLRVVSMSDAAEEDEKPLSTNGNNGNGSIADKGTGNGEDMMIDPSLDASGEAGDGDDDEGDGENDGGHLTPEQERAKAAAEYFKNWQALSAARLDAERRIRHLQLHIPGTV